MLCQKLRGHYAYCGGLIGNLASQKLFRYEVVRRWALLAVAPSPPRPHGLESLKWLAPALGAAVVWGASVADRSESLPCRPGSLNRPVRVLWGPRGATASATRPRGETTGLWEVIDQPKDPGPG